MNFSLTDEGKKIPKGRSCQEGWSETGIKRTQRC